MSSYRLKFAPRCLQSTRTVLTSKYWRLSSL